jgi:hypothetical protein
VLVAVTGALGITRASVLLTVRGRLDQWSQLLWQRAVVQKVVDRTLTLDEVLPPPESARRCRTGAVRRAREWRPVRAVRMQWSRVVTSP